MSTKEIIQSLITRANDEQKSLSIHRDRLRTLVSEMENLLETLDEGIDDINYGIEHIEAGIERLSEQL